MREVKPEDSAGGGKKAHAYGNGGRVLLIVVTIGSYEEGGVIYNGRRKFPEWLWITAS